MPKFNFHMGVDARVYGNVRDVEAATLDDAVAMLTPDYVAENFETSETTTDVVSNLTIIDAQDAEGESLGEYSCYDLPDLPKNAPPATDTITALVQAESFISGFEDDETQEGVADMLAGLRAAIAREQAKPAITVDDLHVAGIEAAAKAEAACDDGNPLEAAIAAYMNVVASPDLLAAGKRILNYAALADVMADETRHPDMVFGIRIGDLRALAAAIAAADAARPAIMSTLKVDLVDDRAADAR